MKVVTSLAETTGYHCPHPDSGWKEVGLGEGPSSKWAFFLVLLQLLKESSETQKGILLNVSICFKEYLLLWFCTHYTGILGHKVTLQSHIRYTHFQNAFPLAVLYIKRWMGTCECLNLIWFGLWMFPARQCCGCIQNALLQQLF